MAYHGKIESSQKKLQDLYEGQGLSVSEVAEYFGCSTDTILRRIKKYGIKQRPWPYELPMQELSVLYEREKWSIYKLASKYHCSHTTIANRIRANGGELTCNREKRGSTVEVTPEVIDTIKRAYASGNSAEFISKSLGLSKWRVLQIVRTNDGCVRNIGTQKSLPMKHVTYLYTRHQLSTVDIGNIYGVQGTTVANRLREAGVELRGARNM